MPASREKPKFRWSDQQIQRALGWHGIPDPDDEIIIRDLAEVGAMHILARRRGGRARLAADWSTERADIRRLLISMIFAGEIKGVLIPPRLHKTPTSPPTLRKVREILEQCGHRVNEATVLNDVKKLGSRTLSGK